MSSRAKISRKRRDGNVRSVSGEAAVSVRVVTREGRTGI